MVHKYIFSPIIISSNEIHSQFLNHVAVIGPLSWPDIIVKFLN